MNTSFSRSLRTASLILTIGASVLIGLVPGCGLTDFSEPQPLNGPCPCPTDQKCYPAVSLGGENFCTDTCDPNEPTDKDHVCEQNGARLQICHPDEATAAADCPRGLNCYRTDLILNRGVCLKIPVCSTDDDCPEEGPRSTCATSLIEKERDPASPLPLPLQLNHLHCVRQACRGQTGVCGDAEHCLGDVYYTPSANFCAPRCEGSTPCPPNFSCDKVTSGQKTIAVCLPGMPGVRCAEQHCLVGACERTGAGFSICTKDCDSDDDCGALNTETQRFQCSDFGHGTFCVTPLPFHGANCSNSQECRADIGEICSAHSDTGVHSEHLECRVPCRPDRTCAPRGGLPHVCFPDGGCYPGQLGLACKDDSECFRDLSCELVPSELRDQVEERLCTMACAADSDCNRPDSFNFNGFCSAGRCRIRREAGNDCTRGAQCISGYCHPTAGTCMSPGQ